MLYRRTLSAILATVLGLALLPAGAAAKNPTSMLPKIEGNITALPDSPDFVGDWTVGTTIVHVNHASAIDDGSATPELGNCASVRGYPQVDGSFLAVKVEVKSSPCSGPVSDDDDITSEVDFVGLVKSLPAGGNIGDWVVSTHTAVGATTVTLHVTTETVVDTKLGKLAVGARVQVKGTLEDDGSVTAESVKVLKAVPTPGLKKVNIRGKVEALPGTPDYVGDWTVAGKTIHVTPVARISSKKPIAVGTSVNVQASQETDGTYTAIKITATGRR